MQWQPLTEQAAALEPPANGLEMFERVERAGAVAGRMEQIRHNHVISALRLANEAASVGDKNLQLRVAAR